MKKILFVMAVIVLAACGSNGPRQITVSGQIENPTAETIEVFYHTNPVTNATERVEVTLDENNAFRATLPMEESNFVYLRMPRRNIVLYLSPGADIHVVFDAEDSEFYPVITGKGTLESRFMTTYAIDIERNYGRMMVLNKAGEMSPEEFVEYMESVYQAKLDYLRGFEGYPDLDPDFVSLMQTNMLYEKYALLMEYPMAYARSNAGDPELPAGYYDFLEEENLFNDDYIKSRAYISFLGNYLNYLHERDVPEDDGRFYFEVRYDLAQDAFTGETRDLMLSNIMISMLNFWDFDKAEAKYQEFLDVAETEKYKEIVSGEYKTVLALSPGKEAPGFTLTNIDGQQVSLSDFEGKVVYLDFWASWCGPCMREVPHAKELKKRMQGRDDLVFLYISVDTDEEAWRRTVEQQEIQGVHLNVPGFSHEVPAAYNLKGVPTFYVIGRDGRIFDNRPPRPSNSRVDEVLLTALDS
jgi:thiol-disulfide isomerase/thioredoxin